jgi:hypothetical protein
MVRDNLKCDGEPTDFPKIAEAFQVRTSLDAFIPLCLDVHDNLTG